ncbi:MAG: potassium transporter Kup [Proteobacteria bacterium]|nr:potassium transporter Kup [Pseudomonadota bacterium]
MMGALGVVFGDIGTSPLYTVQESFHQTGMPVTPENIFRFLSMIFWLLAIVVSIKYITFIMRAGNKGEGGNLALLALVLRLTRPNPTLFYIMGLLGILGGSLFYADAVITPAISVLSAMEGIEVIKPVFHHFILPLTIIILIVLFAAQKHGTRIVGGLFGPVIIVWFIALGVLGFSQIIRAPAVLQAVNPLYALTFMVTHPFVAFVAIGATVLSVTGAEALYADMGHFGIKPIRYTWFMMVWPCLLLNYFGQGALLLKNPAAIENPFYLMAPEILSVPLLLLAAMATIIASQAVISGTFSLTRQAVQLGYLPRMQILHTSAQDIGQIYIPFVNWLLLVPVIAVVLIFQSSTGLAAAYGVAVTGAMLITSIMVAVVMRLKWHWGWWRMAVTAGLFVAIDTILFSSTATKIVTGGYVPLLIATVIFTLLTTWKSGQRILNEKMSRSSVSIEHFIKEVYKNPPMRVPGTAVYMTPWHNVIPSALLQNIKHNKVLHERVIFLTVVSQEVPYVPPENRIHVYQLGQDFYQLDIHSGFKDEPDVPAALHQCQVRGMDFDHIHQASFFMGKETVVPTPEDSGMARWREHVFAWMKQNASSAISYYKIPQDRVIELGGRYEI